MCAIITPRHLGTSPIPTPPLLSLRLSVGLYRLISGIGNLLSRPNPLLSQPKQVSFLPLQVLDLALNQIRTGFAALQANEDDKVSNHHAEKERKTKWTRKKTTYWHAKGSLSAPWAAEPISWPLLRERRSGSRARDPFSGAARVPRMEVVVVVVVAFAIGRERMMGWEVGDGRKEVGRRSIHWGDRSRNH